MPNNLLATSTVIVAVVALVLVLVALGASGRLVEAAKSAALRQSIALAAS